MSKRLTTERSDEVDALHRAIEVKGIRIAISRNAQRVDAVEKRRWIRNKEEWTDQFRCNRGQRHAAHVAGQ